MEKEQKRKFKLFIGVVAIAFAIVCFVNASSFHSTCGATEMAQTFGADFYTYVQQAAAQAATNSYHTNKMLLELGKGLYTVAGFALLIVGALIITSAIVTKEQTTVAVANNIDTTNTAE